ncbi:MAG: hypothetical protein ACK5XA_08620 [Tagaea sp.]
MTRLTPLQYEIARLVATGLPRDEVARRTGSTRATVSHLVCRVRHRLGVTDDRHLAAALLECIVTTRGVQGRIGRRGLRIGDPVRITGGRFAGRDGTYVGFCNSDKARIQIGGGHFYLDYRFIEPVREAA